MRLSVFSPGRLRVSSMSLATPASSLGLVQTCRPSILVLSMRALRLTRRIAALDSLLRRDAHPGYRVRCPWSGDGTNVRYGTEPPIPMASQPSARRPSGEQRTSGVRCSSSRWVGFPRFIWLRHSQFKVSGRWLDGPCSGIFYGLSSALFPLGCGVQIRSSLRMRLLIS